MRFDVRTQRNKQQNDMQLQWLERFRLLILDDIDSTNSEAKRIIRAELSDENVVNDMVIWSKNQSHGRGRYSKSWISCDGNLFMSIIVRAEHTLDVMTQLSFVSAVAVREAIASLCTLCDRNDIVISTKWPNDILMNDKKVAGILLESLGNENSDYIVVGIGVNLLSPGLDSATSFLNNSIDTIDASDVLSFIMDHFIKYYDIWIGNENGVDFESIRNLWLQHAAMLGQSIKIQTANRDLSGRFIDIDSSGAICIDCDGKIDHIATGEVFL